jgi:hypothetical protein
VVWRGVSWRWSLLSEVAGGGGDSLHYRVRMTEYWWRGAPSRRLMLLTANIVTKEPHETLGNREWIRWRVEIESQPATGLVLLLAIFAWRVLFFRLCLRRSAGGDKH